MPEIRVLMNEGRANGLGQSPSAIIAARKDQAAPGFGYFGKEPPRHATTAVSIPLKDRCQTKVKVNVLLTETVLSG